MPRAIDDGARRWMFKHAHKNLWRVAHWYDLDCLIQDGHMCWQIAVTRYPHVTDRPHLMSLFRTIYTNHVHQLANRRTAQAAEIAVEMLPTTQHCPDAELLAFVQEAPMPLRQCLTALLGKPELAKVPHRRWLGGRREDTNAWLCGLAGVDPAKFDVRAQLMALLARARI